MTQKVRILFLSASPWGNSRILVDEEAREISERINEGPYRDCFELYNHTALEQRDRNISSLVYTIRLKE